MVFVCTTPRQGGLSYVVRQDNFVPGRRFREDGLEDLKLSRGGGARVNTLGALTLGAPAVAKQAKPINSDSMQVEVEPVVSIYPEAKQFRLWRPCGTLNNALLCAFFFYRTFMDRTPVVVRVLHLFLVCN